MASSPAGLQSYGLVGKTESEPRVPIVGQYVDGLLDTPGSLSALLYVCGTYGLLLDRQATGQ